MVTTYKHINALYWFKQVLISLEKETEIGLNFQLPVEFFYSTVVILVSSLSMIYAFRSAKKDELEWC